MKILSPIAYSERHKRNIPVLDIFEDISLLINQDTDKAKAYKKKLLGETVIVGAPNDYWDIGLTLEAKIPLDQWEKMDIHTRAKIQARTQLHNITEIIKHHYELMAEARERALKAKPQNGI